MKNPKYTFCTEFHSEHTHNFLDDDVIIVTSSDSRTQLIRVLFSPSVYYHNSQVINSIRTTEKNEKV